MLPLSYAPNFANSSPQELGIEKLLELNTVNSHTEDHYFYSIFSNKKSGAAEQMNALIFLATSAPAIRASLSIFEKACDRYIQIIVYGILDIMSNEKKAEKSQAFLN